MGRYPYSSRYTVKEYPSISVNWLKRNNYLKFGTYSGNKGWTTRQSNRDLGDVGFDVVILEDISLIRFRYAVIDKYSKEIKFDYTVKLVSTPCNYGGKRWWFLCPLLINNSQICCNRRVGFLYLGAEYFGCRHCHNLTYTSCQESHKYDAMLRKFGLNFEEAKQIY